MGKHQRIEAAWRWYGIGPIATEVERKSLNVSRILQLLRIQDELVRMKGYIFLTLHLSFITLILMCMFRFVFVIIE